MSTFMSLLGLGTGKLNLGMHPEGNIMTLRNIFFFQFKKSRLNIEIIFKICHVCFKQVTSFCTRGVNNRGAQTNPWGKPEQTLFPL